MAIPPRALYEGHLGLEVDILFGDLRNGDPASTRTRDPLLRRQMLYPAELRDRK